MFFFRFEYYMVDKFWMEKTQPHRSNLTANPQHKATTNAGATEPMCLRSATAIHHNQRVENFERPYVQFIYIFDKLKP